MQIKLVTFWFDDFQHDAAAAAPSQSQSQPHPVSSAINTISTGGSDCN